MAAGGIIVNRKSIFHSLGYGGERRHRSITCLFFDLFKLPAGFARSCLHTARTRIVPSLTGLNVNELHFTCAPYAWRAPLLRRLLPGRWRRWFLCVTLEPATSPANHRNHNDNGRDNTGDDPIVHDPFLPVCWLHSR
jgi:hypothetical protein